MLILTSNSKEAQQAAQQGVARGDRTYAATFLADLDELEAAGIPHKDVARARKLLRE
ncbi:MAG TPA: hypothetical protein PKD70_08290 [Saprospiraceae bacterium]|nr:hypothetical protein [Saprospiraceae bacterium]